MNTELIDCEKCGSKSPRSEMIFDVSNVAICDVCTVKALEMAQTIKIFESSGVYEYIWTKEFGFQDRKTKDRVAGVSGIRGYALDTEDDVWKPLIDPAFDILISGWEFDFNDPSKKRFVDFIRNLGIRYIIPPVPIIINMTQMGGLKMRIDIISRKKDNGKFLEWVKTSQGLQLN